MASRQLDEEAIFHVAREIGNPEARARYLEQICAGDQSLRERVEELLKAHERESEFLKSSADPGPTECQSPISERPGQQIGRYKLLDKLGEGGMGTVFMAEQLRPVKRRVAVKIIKQGMDTQQFVARFEAERQALALMDHPNIARVLDAGCTDTGRPYFVMELVKGVPITQFCDENRLTPRQRVELFVSVCHAVQHAHQKGIIHRDLKPSNVLVALYDDKPVPKVIDFGVAKATNQQLTERTLFTQVGQIVGTWEYMSPEQAVLNQLDVDTRTDVYALGVILYELLTGVTPLDPQRLRSAALEETLRLIREEDPPKPSNRVSSLGDTATATAAYRGTDANSLARTIRGDIDWIVMKALEKRRSRRYETANAMAADLNRFLDGEAIEARPPSAMYRLQKIASRHRAALATTVIITLTLLVATITSSWLAVRERQARIEANEQRNRATRLLDKHHKHLIERALLHAVIGDVEEVNRTVAEAEEMGVPEDWILTLRGAAYLHEGDNTRAQTLLEEATAINDENVSAHALLSVVYMHSGNKSEWSLKIESVRKKEPRPEYREFDTLFLSYSQFYVDYEKAAQELEELLSRHRTWVVPRSILAGAWAEAAQEYGSSQYAGRALDEIEGPRQIAEDNPFILMVSVFVHYSALLVNPERAEEIVPVALADATRLDEHPSYALGSMLRATLYDYVGELERALKAWRDVLHHGDGFLVSRAVAQFYRYGIEQEALQLLRSGMDDEARIAEAYVLALTPGREDEAIAIYDELSKLNNTWYMRHNLLQILLLCHEITRAQEECAGWLETSTGIDSQTQYHRECIELVAHNGRAGEDMPAEPSSPAEFYLCFQHALLEFSEHNVEGAVDDLEKCLAVRYQNTLVHWAGAFHDRWSKQIPGSD